MSDAVYFNGLDGDSGSYLLDPRTDAEIATALLAQLRGRRLPEEPDSSRGPILTVDAQRLEQAGWGLVMPEDVGEGPAAEHWRAVRRALDPLCELRAREAGPLYRDSLTQPRPLFYRPNESAEDFLYRYGARPEDPVDPADVPYYLLLVGDPETIPFEFQFDLDIQYAVGRICFDRPQDYAAYATAVVNAARGEVQRQREVAIFAVERDPTTCLTANSLARPLAESLAAVRDGWRLHTRFGPDADRAQLAALMQAAERRPALLFTAGHGVGFRGQSEPRQKLREEMQGALVCQDWEGPGTPLARQHYLGAPDLEDAHVDGLIAMFFACYSAGTPQFDSFETDDQRQPRQIASRPFVSRLVQRMLSHPNGAALAVIGHVDRAWTHSFGDGAFERSRIAVFDNLVQGLLQGRRVGYAMEPFAFRYAALGTQMSNIWESLGTNRRSYTLDDFGSAWRNRNDARNFVLFGDPAVRLAVGELG
jgi:Peptidase family C25